MRAHRTLGLIAAAGLLIAACGSSAGPTATSAGGGGGATEPGATEPSATQPSATENGGQPTATAAGGGGGGGGANSVRFEITSPILNKSGDLPFVGGASVFAGDLNTSLSFSNAATTDVLGILIVAGHVAVSYSAGGDTVAGPVCTSTDVQVNGTSASGSFDCLNADVLTAAGGIGKGEIKGTFSGSK